jgi:hypothetical protein
VVGPEPLHGLTVELRMFAVELSGVDVNPQFVNPATLQFNDVVEKGWSFDKGVRTGITESALSYTNGLQIEAFDDIVRFQHSGPNLKVRGPLSAEVAKRYVEAFGVDNWFGVSLEFAGPIGLEGYPDNFGVSLPPALSNLLIHNGVTPGVRAGTFYQYPDRNLQVDLQQSPVGSSHMGLAWIAQVYRSLARSQDDQTENQVESVLSEWERDLEDVVAAVSLLVQATLNPRGS